MPANARAPREEDTRFLLGLRPLRSWEQMSLLPAQACELGWRLLLLSGKREPWMEISGLPQRGKLSLPWLLPLPSGPAPNPSVCCEYTNSSGPHLSPASPWVAAGWGAFIGMIPPTLLRKGAGGAHKRTEQLWRHLRNKGKEAKKEINM